MTIQLFQEFLLEMFPFSIEFHVYHCQNSFDYMGGLFCSLFCCLDIYVSPIGKPCGYSSYI